jgi:nucleoside-diphosphate-sugar epimerase/dTDP-4-dehydrorhamnose 3,5-epimerase-like enzyme/2-polyprenyl-3-methyl-5-hydroxy-6-metoxy-1,4-benzoquinol methylase
MKKKIIITGGLGYIGYELSRIYSGSSWHNEIIVIDRNFYSARVKQLTEWNIKFFQGDILDKNFLKKHIYDANIIHHLAGITNVAYVRSDINKERDDEIKRVAIQGTNNILNLSNHSAKIIFPSTHVVFDGLSKSEDNIKESRTKVPILPYSISKSQNEEDIKSSGKNYVILRLGSVYGFSDDATRIQIVPNLFSKLAASNGKISLFGRGVQKKSLVSIIDVARCFKFMEEKNEIKKQTFNISNENISVKEIAYKCKKVNPNLNIIETEEEIPNAGYTLSNTKILKTGFKFLYKLPESINEMVNNWKNKKKSVELEYLEYGKNNFIDKRGFITNYELTEAINLIGLIYSKKGTIRANHYHPIQEQKCLVTKGGFISLYKDLLSEDDRIITQFVSQNQITVTKPNVAHAMIFTEDTTFLNLVRGERDHKNYGITHTIPHQLVDRVLADEILKGYKQFCRVCDNTNLLRVVSFGFIPLANNLQNSKLDKAKKYPLELNYCNQCYNCQLSYVANPIEIFSSYLYVSSTSKIFRDHFKNAADKYIKKLNLKKNNFIIDIGSNDGIALKPFKEKNYNNILGIEPAKNIAKIANKNGIKTLNAFFDESILKKIHNQKASLILASNVFAHSDKINEITKTIKKIIDPNGILIIEIQYLMNTIIDTTFDNIYHEHVNYWSIHSLKTFFDKHEMTIYDCEKIDTHGGSLRVYIANNQKKVKIKKSVKKLLKEEIKLGIDNFKIFEDFRNRIEKIKTNVKKNMENLSNKYKNIYGFGAPAKATTSLNYFGIEKYFNGVFEDNELKYNKYIPGTNLKILKKNNKLSIDCLIVFAWNFFNDIKKNNITLSENIISIKEIEN